jgi:lipopolysaccharide/colanic/teichoic acid biosynthesis glycosyltransferase
MLDLTVIKPPRVLPHRYIYDRLKRVVDLLACTLTLPLSVPLMGLIAVLIRLDSPGPALFVQERIGKGGRLFKIYKFRTLHMDLNRENCAAYMRAYVRGELGCDQAGEKVFKPVKNHQVTRVGRLLRKTSLDELPQIFNVLRGEMSIVGPRPNVTWEVDAYHPWHHERLEVLPGITGLAQVRGRSCIDFNSLVRADVEYIERRGFALDMAILWWTFLAVVRRKGAK